MTFQELSQRGLVKQTTNSDKVGSLIDNGSTFYIGFDPTASSLHVGHLLQLITAKRLSKNNKIIILVGGATATIGDPTGKSEARKVLFNEEVLNNISGIEKQFQKILNCPFQLVNNSDWLGQLFFLDLLKKVGRHFSINNMLRAECFKSRMENGLSFLEFNYMIMQSYDFLHLFENHKCMLQIGGDDQWSNILGGINLIHKIHKQEVFGLTLPLLVNSNGVKMGKTENGAIWLDKNKTSVFDFFQYWRNVSDEDVVRLFKLLTFVPVEEINNIPFSNAKEINDAKKRLAFEITSIAHGEEEALGALKQSEDIFENKLSSNLNTVIAESNSIVDVIVQSGFAKSKTEARNLINGKGIFVDDNVVSDFNYHLPKEFVLRKGKKSFVKVLVK